MPFPSSVKLPEGSSTALLEMNWWMSMGGGAARSECNRAIRRSQRDSCFRSAAASNLRTNCGLCMQPTLPCSVCPGKYCERWQKYFTDQQMVVFVCFCPVYLTCSGATLVVRLRGVSVTNHLLLFGILRFSDCIKYSWQAGKKASSFNYAKQKGASKPKNEWMNGIQTKMNKNCYSADLSQ